MFRTGEAGEVEAEVTSAVELERKDFDPIQLREGGLSSSSLSLSSNRLTLLCTPDEDPEILTGSDEGGAETSSSCCFKYSTALDNMVK